MLILLPIHLSAQEMEVPIKLQYSLIGKILSFDRTLKIHSKDDVVVGILFQNKYRASLNVKNQLLECVKADPNNKIDGHAIRWVSFEISSGDEISSALARENIDVLYITPMRDVGITDITNLTRSNHILTITGVPTYVGEGLAVGIGAKGEKPVIYVNFSASKAEGADFNSQFLKFVQIVETVNQ